MRRRRVPFDPDWMVVLHLSVEEAESLLQLLEDEGEDDKRHGLYDLADLCARLRMVARAGRERLDA